MNSVFAVLTLCLLPFSLSWPWHRALWAPALSAITTGYSGLWWSELWELLSRAQQLWLLRIFTGYQHLKVPNVVFQFLLFLPLPSSHSYNTTKNILEKYARKVKFQRNLEWTCHHFSCVNVKIFLINLKRRQDRRTRMLKTMASLGLHATLMDAVDGK